MWGNRNTERGATGVEVALMIAFVALIVVGAVQLAGSSSSDELGAAADGIDKAEGGSGGSGGTGGTGGTGGSGSTTVPTTASTVPPTTPSSTTSSTTTTTTTTTTPEPDGPIVATPSVDHITTTSLGDGEWEASTTITITDADGEPVEGAIVAVRIREYTIRANGSWGWQTVSTVDMVTGPDGTIDVDAGPYEDDGDDPVTGVRIQAREVDVGDAGEWDGTRRTRTAYAP